jgi:starvation-inducible DNA-binding protein
MIMSNTPVTDNLHQTLVDSYALYLKTQNYHWNVTGPHFKSLHELFEEQYTDLAEAIDELAERIRALGATVPASLALFAEKTSLGNNDAALANDMVKDLVAANEHILATLKSALSAAQQADDEVTIGMVTDRLGVHEKALWMLKSSVA